MTSPSCATPCAACWRRTVCASRRRTTPPRASPIRRWPVCRLVLCDLMLPDRSGIEVLEEIARRRPDLPVLVITGYATAEHAARAREAGAAGLSGQAVRGGRAHRRRARGPRRPARKGGRTMTVLIVLLMFAGFVVLDLIVRAATRRLGDTAPAARTRSGARYGAAARLHPRGAEPEAGRAAEREGAHSRRRRRARRSRCAAQDPDPRRLQRRHRGERTGSPRARAAQRLRPGLHRSEDAGHERRRGRQGRQAPAPGRRRRRHHRLCDDRFGRRNDARRGRGLRAEALHPGGADRLRPPTADEATGPPRGATPAAVRVVAPALADTAPANEFCVPGGAFLSDGHAWARIESWGHVRDRPGRLRPQGPRLASSASTCRPRARPSAAASRSSPCTGAAWRCDSWRRSRAASKR